jgi:cation diffusion facilitator CzcD-associated flavoprotein CzcO
MKDMMTPLADAEARVAALTERARSDLALMSYPNRSWVRPPATALAPVIDVVIVGAGQAGLAAGLALWREGVSNTLLVDRSAAGFEGPWETYARMETLRTPKTSIGLESGIPSMTARAWHAARYGAAAWEGFARVPRVQWMEYLRWLRQVVGLTIRNRTEVGALAPAGDGLIKVPLAGGDGPAQVYARHVVLATGFDGCGSWHIPQHISRVVPPERLEHSNVPFDLGRLAGLRVGILGHGASAFDTAAAALKAGAASVDVCYRRRDIPQINPHRHLEYVGLLKHYGELPPALRWEIAHFFDTRDQPPTQNAWDAATAFPNCRVHASCPWDELEYRDGVIRVKTPRGLFGFDFIICATGSMVDLAARPELRDVAAHVARWGDRYQPPPALEHPVLAQYPYVGEDYQLQERVPGSGHAWLNRVYAYNFSSYVSMGPHSTSVSAHKYSIPRMVRGITRALMFEQLDAVMPGIAAYDEIELRLPPARAAA